MFFMLLIMRTNYICSKTPKGLSCYYVSSIRDGSKAKASAKLSLKKRPMLRTQLEKKKVDLQSKMSKLRPKFHLNDQKIAKILAHPSGRYRKDTAQKMELKKQEDSISEHYKVGSTPVEEDEQEKESAEYETKPPSPLDCGKDLVQDVREYFSLIIAKHPLLSSSKDLINPLGVMMIYNIETRAMMLPPIFGDEDRCILVRITPKQLAQLISMNENDPEPLITKKTRKTFDLILKRSAPNWIYKVFLFNQPKMPLDLELPFEIVYGDSIISLLVEPSTLIAKDSKDNNNQHHKTLKPENLAEQSPQKPTTPSTSKRPCGSKCKDYCLCHGCCCGCSRENIVQVKEEEKHKPRLQPGHEEVLEIFGHFTFPSGDD